MGGTTTDIALVTNHEPKLDQEGAVVGGWRTRVKAAEIYTYGIGGDSYIQVKPDKKLITVGPERVLPLSYAAWCHPNLIAELSAPEISASGLAVNQKTDCFTLAKKVHHAERSRFSSAELRILDLLQDNPHSLYYLSKRLDIEPNFFPSAQLLKNGAISRISLTPTDVLHVTNEYKLWSCEAAQLGIALVAAHSEMSQTDFIKAIKAEITREIAITLVQSLIAMQQDNFPIKKYLNYNFIKKIFEPGLDNYFTCKIHIPLPVIAIGAPVKAWLPKIKEILSLDIIIPEHAEVANAFGAATANMIERVEVIIRPKQGQAGFSIHLPWEYKVLYDFASAVQYASDAATDWVRNRLIQAGADEPEVRVVRRDLFVEAMGDKILLETLLKINAVGKPNYQNKPMLKNWV